MRNIPKKGWSTWGIVILTLVLNVALIKAVNNHPAFLWLLIISIVLFVMVLYRAFHEKRSLFFFTKSSKSFTQRPHFEILSQPFNPTEIAKDDLRVSIGNAQCSKTYHTSVLSLRAWENTEHRFGQTDLNGKEPDTPGRIVSNYSNTIGSSVAGPIWQIDATYEGCQTENGNFSSVAFKRTANMPEVKMIVINLPSPVKADYWTDSSLTMVNPIGEKEKPDLFTRSGYTAFRDAEGLVHFTENLRNLSGGKPVGIRLSIGDKKDFCKICHAIRKTQIIPDFIMVTGSTVKTVLSHPDVLFYPQIPLYEALLFVSQTLQAYGLTKDVKVIAEGEVISGFDVLKLLALGANSVCINSNYFDISESGNSLKIKYPYLNNNIYFRLMSELVQIMNVGGFRNIEDVTLSKFLGRLDVLHSKRYTQTEEQVLPGGSVTKMFYEKANKIESMDRRTRGKASVQ